MQNFRLILFKNIRRFPKVPGIMAGCFFVLLAYLPVQAAWFDSNYQFKRRIVIPAGQVTGSHSYFPVLIDGTNFDGSFFSHVLQAGPQLDILFTNAAEDTRLNREIVVFDPAGRKMEAWVQLPGNFQCG